MGTADPDKVDTNLMGSDNTVVVVGQDIAAHIAADAAVHKALTSTVTKGFKSIGVKNVKVGNKLLFNMLVSKKNQEKIAKTLVNRVKQRAMTSIKSMGKKAIAALGKQMGKQVGKKVVAQVGKKVAVKAGTVLAEGAIKAGVVGGSICATTGAETLGIGCAVGAVVTVVMLAFDVMNMVFGALDPDNISFLFHRKDIDDMAETLRKQMLEDPNDDKYFEDEIMFDPLLFIFDTDPVTHEIVVDEIWGKKYNDYQDEYMKSIGITGDWRARVQATAFEQPQQPPKPPPTVNNNLIIGIIVGVITLIIVILLLVL